MKRGEIYYIESTYRETGSEQRGGRPAVIVSNDKNNENSEVVEVVYMTTKPKNDLPTHVFIRSALSPSTVLCEQVNSVSVKRIGTLIGKLTRASSQPWTLLWQSLWGSTSWIRSPQPKKRSIYWKK